ncbi:hypothetical protein [Stappia phage SI01]|uniref:Uncharacterized protein n=1 Tax=Stappia phage SI01 TaxID=2847766 RepID=A0AAE7SQJ3_9CAUD|nr:hypothetical protein [Stappia phage SI01]
MLTLTFAAVAMTLTVLFIFARLHLLRFLGYATVADVVFSVSLFYVFAGTFSGIVASALSGLFMTGALSFLRRVLGYERLVWVRWYKLPRWKYSAPVWTIAGLTSKLTEKVHV